MMTREELTNRLLALKGLRELLVAEDLRLRAEALEHFARPGTREIGTLGETLIGSVSLAKGISTWVVSDPDAFLAWVKEHRPEEVETQQRVRPSYQAAVLAAMKAEDGVVEEGTGEVICPPGVIPRKGDPQLRVTPIKGVTSQAVLDALGETATLLGLARPAVEA